MLTITIQCITPENALTIFTRFMDSLQLFPGPKAKTEWPFHGQKARK